MVVHTEVRIPSTYTVFMDDEIHEGIGKIEISEGQNQSGLELKIFQDADPVDSFRGDDLISGITIKEGYSMRADSEKSFQVRLYDAREGHERENYNSVACLRAFQSK